MRLNLQFCMIFFMFTVFFLVSSALECKANDRDPAKVAYTIIVSKLGDGKFTNVKDAINSIPSGNDQWIRILVTRGTYIEQIRVLKDKTCILLQGQSAQDTIITYGEHTTTLESVTFGIYAENFIAKDITFKNSFNRALLQQEDDDENGTPAVAFGSYADKHAFYNVRFEGYQDTLWDDQGRHFFKSCYIEGAIDFIFGEGQSVYEQCSINVTGEGFITANKRQAAADPSGFVFDGCHVTGRGEVYLGRAWGPYSRVIFRNSNFDNMIRPEGWNIWRQQGHENDVTYAEVNCTGPGANTSQRILMKKLSEPDVNQFSAKSFVNQDGWIDRLPCFLC